MRARRSDFFAPHRPADIAFFVQVEDEEGEAVLFAEGEGGRVHHLEAAGKNLGEA